MNITPHLKRLTPCCPKGWWSHDMKAVSLRVARCEACGYTKRKQRTRW